VSTHVHVQVPCVDTHCQHTLCTVCCSCLLLIPLDTLIQVGNYCDTVVECRSFLPVCGYTVAAITLLNSQHTQCIIIIILLMHYHSQHTHTLPMRLLRGASQM
jgi:hypothetical protein